ncbi:Cro/CI family transcriptional regulator [Pseudomonas sp. EA_35y_Pfl2_R111]|uniref:Cro/CI family transcriptional regulator n=1 Tax=Pseudomonas sp. EA_35y_Pfl2_R111 TaxID=3088689 RepID=UPI0030DC2CD1
MKRTPLTKFVEARTQEECALLLGCTQGAISKALRVGRAVFVTENDDGTFTAEELRPFPSQAVPKKSAA